MASCNKVFLIGNLTRDPENKYTPGGSGVCDMGIAVNEKYKKDDEWVEKAGFFDVTAWGKLGETCGEYLKKGSLVFIEGKLNFSQWETDDGSKRSKVSVTAQNIQFLDPKQKDEPAF